MDITQLLAFSVKNKASDLHLSSGLPPMIRVHGDVRRINVEALDHRAVHDMVYDIMNDAQRKTFEDTLECDFSFEIQGLARFRVNAFNQNRGTAAAPRSWLKALTRKRARPGMENEKSHSRTSSYCLRWPSFMMS